MRYVVVALFLSALQANVAQGQSRPEFHILRASVPPKIDGDLQDEVWNDNPLSLGEWVSYNPLYGEKMSLGTLVRISYDDRNLYFSFHCLDNEPGKIRTTISRRDSTFNDDWVGFSLDSNGTGQTSYHLFVNPSGIQMDAINTAAAGERFEADFVWDSAGKVTEDGYVVEIRLPLQSIRFKNGKNVRMGVLFWRRISRTGVSSAWPEIPPGQWVFNRHAHLVFENLKQPKVIEVLPSVTYSMNQSRTAPGAWNPATQKGDPGLSAKYGITSSIALDATINPDFSQVESDAFQVLVNQRFPVFYSEKRPFFMEGMGLFNIAGTGGDGNMRTGVHTRKIINPSWGSKLTGTQGRLTFGLLNASDESPEDIGNRGAAIEGSSKLFTIARATYGFGESNYVGGIFTDTEHAGRHNRVAGSDVSLRFKKGHEFSATFLTSQTGISENAGAPAVAAQTTYSYSQRRFLFITQVEHYGRDFQMDTAFFNRTGFTTGWAYSEVNLYPKDTSKSWLKRLSPFIFTRQGRDQVQDGNERYFLTGIRFRFTRQGFLSIQRTVGSYEPWIGRQFKVGGTNIFGNVQILRWLGLSGGVGQGPAIYYDPVNPFQGRRSSSNISITLQPNQHINQSIGFNAVRFDRSSDGQRIYAVNIMNLRTTYQFSKHLLARAIEQYDSSRRRLLIDLLASYEFIPGTVFHAGYGSLFEKTGTAYIATSRGLFFKASYLHRF